MSDWNIGVIKNIEEVMDYCRAGYERLIKYEGLKRQQPLKSFEKEYTLLRALQLINNANTILSTLSLKYALGTVENGAVLGYSQGALIKDFVVPFRQFYAALSKALRDNSDFVEVSHCYSKLEEVYKQYSEEVE